jgi:chromosome segregation ATPase
MQQFYIAREGAAFGPLSVEETNRMVLEGGLDRSTLVWDGNRHDWIDASAHPIISRIFDRHLTDDTDDAKSEADLITRQVVMERTPPQATPEPDDTRRRENDRLEEERAAGLAQLESARERLAEIESAVEATSQKHEELTRSLHEAEARAAATTAASDEAAALLEKHGTELKVLEAKIVRYQAEEEKRARAAEEAIRETTARHEKRRAELAALEAETARRRDAEAERVRVAEEATRETTALHEKRRAELAALEAETARRRDAEAERARAAEEAARATELRLESARLAQAEIEAELQSRRRATEKVEAERRAGEKRLLALRDETERLGRMAAESRATREETEKALHHLRAETSTAIEARDAITREADLLRRDRAVLHEEMNSLEMRRAAYDAEIELVNDRLAAIRAETAALEEKRLEAEALLGREVHAAFDEIRTAVGELGRLTSTWSEFKTADEKHRHEGLAAIDAMARRIREREAELAEVFARIGDRARIDGERALAETARDEAATRAGEIKDELKSLTVLCWEELQSLEKAREERAHIMEEIESLRDESATMATRQEDLIDEVSGLVGRRASLEMECSTLDEAIKTLERERSAHETERDEMRHRRERLTESIREIEAEAAVAAGELARRRGAIVATESRVAELERMIEDRRREIEAEETRLAGIRDEARCATAEAEAWLSSIRGEARREAAAIEDRRSAAREAAEKAEADLEARLTARRAEMAAETAEVEERLTSLQLNAERFNAEEDRRRLTAIEARREVEEEIEGAIRTVADLRAKRESTAAAIELLESRRGDASAELLRLEEETRRIEARRAVAETILGDAETRLAEIEARQVEREKMLGRLREEEGERAGRIDRLAAEIDQLDGKRAKRAEDLRDISERAALAAAELETLEKERTTRGLADLKDLRDLLRLREKKEHENLEKMLLEARSEFKQLQEDWVHEERGGATNEELRRIREEVEDRRRELTKAERQLAAMRAGLSKLREENGRSLLQRAQAFEVQQLEELRRRITESKSETEALENSWASEMKSAELVDRQWFEIRSTLEK